MPKEKKQYLTKKMMVKIFSLKIYKFKESNNVQELDTLRTQLILNLNSSDLKYLPFFEFNNEESIEVYIIVIYLIVFSFFY